MKFDSVWPVVTFVVGILLGQINEVRSERRRRRDLQREALEEIIRTLPSVHELCDAGYDADHPGDIDPIAKQLVSMTVRFSVLQGRIPREASRMTFDCIINQIDSLMDWQHEFYKLSDAPPDDYDQQVRAVPDRRRSDSQAMLHETVRKLNDEYRTLAKLQWNRNNPLVKFGMWERHLWTGLRLRVADFRRLIKRIITER